MQDKAKINADSFRLPFHKVDGDTKIHEDSQLFFLTLRMADVDGVPICLKDFPRPFVTILLAFFQLFDFYGTCRKSEEYSDEEECNVLKYAVFMEYLFDEEIGENDIVYFHKLSGVRFIFVMPENIVLFNDLKKICEINAKQEKLRSKNKNANKNTGAFKYTSEYYTCFKTFYKQAMIYATLDTNMGVYYINTFKNDSSNNDDSVEEGEAEENGGGGQGGNNTDVEPRLLASSHRASLQSIFSLITVDVDMNDEQYSEFDDGFGEFCYPKYVFRLENTLLTPHYLMECILPYTVLWKPCYNDDLHRLDAINQFNFLKTGIKQLCTTKTVMGDILFNIKEAVQNYESYIKEMFHDSDERIKEEMEKMRYSWGEASFKSMIDGIDVSKSRTQISKYLKEHCSTSSIINFGEIEPYLDIDDVSYSGLFAMQRKLFMEYYMDLINTHKYAEIMIYCALDAYRSENSLHNNLIIAGEAGTGKSHTLKCVENSLIPGTISKISQQTEKSHTGNEYNVDDIIILHEMPETMIGIGKMGSSDVNGSAIEKTLLTENVITHKMMTVVEGVRIPVTSKSIHRFVRLGLTNADLSKIPAEIRSRYICLDFLLQERTSKEPSKPVNESKDNVAGRNQFQPALKRFRQCQATVSIVSELIHIGALKIDLSVVEYMFSVTINQLRKDGVITNSNNELRKKDMILNIATIMVIMDAAERNYFVPSGKNYNKPFTYQSIMDMQPLLFCTDQIASYTLLLLYDYLFDPTIVYFIGRLLNNAKDGNAGTLVDILDAPSSSRSNRDKYYVITDPPSRESMYKNLSGESRHKFIRKRALKQVQEPKLTKEQIQKAHALTEDATCYITKNYSCKVYQYFAGTASNPNKCIKISVPFVKTFFTVTSKGYFKLKQTPSSIVREAIEKGYSQKYTLRKKLVSPYSSDNETPHLPRVYEINKRNSKHYFFQKNKDIYKKNAPRNHGVEIKEDYEQMRYEMFLKSLGLVEEDEETVPSALKTFYEIDNRDIKKIVDEQNDILRTLEEKREDYKNTYNNDDDDDDDDNNNDDDDDEESEDEDRQQKRSRSDSIYSESSMQSKRSRLQPEDGGDDLLLTSI